MSFLKDVIELANKLLLLPKDLNIIVLTLSTTNNTDDADRQGRLL